MKALLTVTGRGIGGDAVIALNTAAALTSKDIQCEYALDHQAPGYLFKKKSIKWHQTSIPQAGGHAASKLNILKAGFQSLKASRETAKLCRELEPDVVVGIIGGGAIVGCTAARMAKLPSVGIVATPTDSKVVSQMTTTIALPESPLFSRPKKDVYPAYMPINPQILGGNGENARINMPEGFQDDLPTILFSSGSSLFEKMAQAPALVNKEIEANILVVGEPLKEEYNKYLKNVLHLGYVDNLPDLYKLADMVVLSDDGLMIHEALACELPTITLTYVKYGRYHHMAGIFPEAVIESNLEDLSQNIMNVLGKKEEIKSKIESYATAIKETPDKIGDIVLGKIK
jgi:UDP-N-acetylglucosamine--N-acetylmuramyl-(pentapeptide) pyrophosphoryl-undecaprenol N-acetylglucosamine transferase